VASSSTTWLAIVGDPKTMRFFFSTPLDVFGACSRCSWKAVWKHLWITLLETVLAFVIGAASGIVIGFWFARKPLVAAVFDPYVKMMNALPRVVLAPIFALWFGLGIWSKVALGVTLVFFIVFFNVYQGVREVPGDPGECPHARHERAAAAAPCLLAGGALLGVLLAAHLGRLRAGRRGGRRISRLLGRPRLSHPRRPRACSTSPASSPAW
jgi:ABC-type amino acid transport system permease subunit